jgi:hypothetical protein
MQAIMPATLVKPAPHEQRAQLANGYMNRCFCLSIHLVSATCNPKLQPNCHQAGAKFGYSSGSRLAVRSTAGCWQLVLLALRRLNVAPRHDDDAIIRIDAFGDWIAIAEIEGGRVEQFPLADEAMARQNYCGASSALPQSARS